MEEKKLQTIEQMIIEKSDKLREIAVESVRQNFDQWTKRAIIEVSQNKELREFIQSNQDTKNQFFVKLSKAAQIGLQIGGTRPHVYFINHKGSLRMLKYRLRKLSNKARKIILRNYFSKIFVILL